MLSHSRTAVAETQRAMGGIDVIYVERPAGNRQAHRHPAIGFQYPRAAAWGLAWDTRAARLAPSGLTP